MPFSDEARSNLGLALANMGQTSDAIAQYREALRLRPGDAATYYNLGLAYVAQKNLGEAKAAFEHAAALQTDYWEARHAIGLVLLMQGQRAAALQQWRALLKANPEYEPTRRALRSAEKMR